MPLTTPAIILCTLNAKYIHASLGLRYLLANMARHGGEDLRSKTALREFTIASPAQQIVVYQLMAAAFYPDPEEGGKDPQPDSAAFYLRRAIRLKPDIQLADEYRWSGIDSLFRVTKSRTFAAVARPSPAQS